MRPTPPFSLLTFPCNAAEINTNFGSENAAMVLKSLKRVKKMFCRFFTAITATKRLGYQRVIRFYSTVTYLKSDDPGPCRILRQYGQLGSEGSQTRGRDRPQCRNREAALIQ